MKKYAKILLPILLPFMGFSQNSGFTLVEDGGVIVLTQYDTIRINGSLMEYRRTESSFPDSTSADYYLSQRAEALLTQAAEWADKAHADSTSAKRILSLLSDAGLRSIPNFPAFNPDGTPVFDGQNMGIGTTSGEQIQINTGQKPAADKPKKGKTTKKKKKNG